MTSVPSNPPDSSSPEEKVDAEALLRSLRRKEGVWREWGEACQILQKMGYTPQQIFEATGFEPIQQNQIVVATQVYQTMVSGGASAPVIERFERTGSDTLYEFRILSQGDRVAAAELCVEKGLDSEGAREIAKALKEFARLADLPQGFTPTAGDGVAYYYWRLARQQADLQARSRLIAQALRFAVSDSARQQVEQLLLDFTVHSATKAPTLPVYRLESDGELPRVMPVVGKLPLVTQEMKAVPLVEEEGPFRLVRSTGSAAWVGVPGWQVVLAADDPVVLVCDSDRLPSPLAGKVEEVLIMVDRAQRQWDAQSYFVVDQDGELQIHWSATAMSDPILGRVLVVLRPRKVLDEDYTKELWQIDE